MLKERGSPALHFLDRYVGIPAIAALGLLRRKRPLPSKIQTIGLLRTVAIGDTVLMSAVIADLRMAFPQARLIFFAGPSNFEIAGMLEGVDRVVKVPTRNVIAGLRAVRSASVDVMIDFGQWPRLEALLTLFSKAAFTIGFRTPGQHRHYGYDVVVEHSPRVHELENYRRLARALGVKCQNAPRVGAPIAEAPAARDYAVFHLWPGGRRKELKQWPAERWLRLIEEFTRRGIVVVLSGAPADRESNDALMAGLSPVARGVVKNAAGASLRQTAAMLAGARIVVSVDTGVMHVAAALGAPLVALHGPTSSKRWGPVSERAIVIDSPLDGCGYLNLGWEYPCRPMRCMECITYEGVRGACFALLEGGSEGSVRRWETPHEAAESETVVT
jgi:ADP-heptose:LPS heptosyltransferase